MFRDEKITQMAASFVRLAGGRVNYMLLIKMLYVADKQMLLQNGTPMSFDKWYSMDYGPVLSTALDLIDGDIHSDYWSSHLKTEKHDLVMVNDPGDDALSVVEDKLLAKVYEEWGHLDPFVAAERTHDPNEFPEWINPHGSSIPIGRHEVLKLNGSDTDKIASILDNIACFEALIDVAGTC